MFNCLPITNEIKNNQNQNNQEMQYLTIQAKFSQPKLTERFQKITQNLDQNFSSRNEENSKVNLNKSKVQRKDTKQTNPSQSKISNQNQNFTKNQPIQDLIEKSQNDPFIRRKLKALMQNDLKSLKKLNDQTGKTYTQWDSKTSLFNDPQDNVTHQQNILESQYTRIPKDIGKILKKFSTKQVNASTLKKMNSQPYLAHLGQNKLIHRQTLPEKERQIKTQKSFTTLRREAYKKKVQNLQILRQVPNQKFTKCQGKVDKN